MWTIIFRKLVVSPIVPTFDIFTALATISLAPVRACYARIIEGPFQELLISFFGASSFLECVRDGSEK